ncbi:transposase [Streptomyces vinaceus]|uniref:Transposase n=1 Tax=Streptomyces vinaceus TaxID=1960 RepID=A0A5J6JFP6_STRVI|nr:transposase [Streptomyces vinaceus]QEV48571.1 transposase [Streptomyces vinaceus]GHE35569.1 putative ISXo8 transposase [Streptomyces vinaceus]
MLTPSDDLSVFCASLFASMPRVAQRRWGEVYVRGLVEVPGRKSVRRISERLLGRRADQSLQQFVNQSSWDWQPVRERIAQLVGVALQPRAWVVEEVVLPKSGRNSVGVDQQYSQTLGRVLNCQLGLVVLAVGPRGTAPVNWRLLLPLSWDADEERRARSRVPDEERHSSRWHHLFDALDELTTGWRARPQPVVVDASGSPSAVALIRGLETRGLPYAVRVDGSTPVERLASGETITLGDRLARTAQARGTVREARGGPGPGFRYSTLLIPASGGSGAGAGQGIGLAQRTRKVVVRWGTEPGSVESAWVTNAEGARSPDLLELLALSSRAGRDLQRLSELSGLRHFEGRSFRGWHHHVTLVSAAHAYRLLRRPSVAAGRPSPQRPASGRTAADHVECLP